MNRACACALCLMLLPPLPAFASGVKIKTARITYTETSGNQPDAPIADKNHSITKSGTRSYKATVNSSKPLGNLVPADVTLDASQKVRSEAKDVKLECIEGADVKVKKIAVTTEETTASKTAGQVNATLKVSQNEGRYEGRLQIPSVGGGTGRLSRVSAKSDACPGAALKDEIAFDLAAFPSQEVDVRFTGQTPKDGTGKLVGIKKGPGYDLSWEIEIDAR